LTAAIEKTTRVLNGTSSHLQHTGSQQACDLFARAVDIDCM
jgi:hypothetical protein